MDVTTGVMDSIWFSGVVAFGFLPGVLVSLVQIVWIPFWAAGVINGIGHHHGYRNWSTKDASVNIVPWGILSGGVFPAFA